MEHQGHGRCKIAHEVKTVRSRNLLCAPLTAPHPPICGENTDARWKLSKPRYGLATSRRERYGTLKDSPTVLWKNATLLDKSVFFWAAKDFHYVYGKCMRLKCMGVTKNGFLRLVEILERTAGVWGY